MSPTSTSKLLERAEETVDDGVRNAFRAYMRLARRQVLGATSTTADASPADLPPNMDAWPGDEAWLELAREHIAPAIGVAFDEAFDAAARADALQVHRHRQAFMDEVFDRLSAAAWPADAFDRIRGDLAEGLDAGESVAQLRERVASELQVERHSYLAERIARTEAHTAVEGGTHSAMRAYEEATGQAMYQRWEAAADTRTRDAHLAANGQTVRVGELFTVDGEQLAYPGDPAGSAANTVNCRCTTLNGTLAELNALPASAAYPQGSAMPARANEYADTYPYADSAEETDPPTEGAPEAVFWRGVLAPLEVRGDYRILAAPEGNTVPVNDRMWLSYQEHSDDGHGGKVAVGRIDRAWVHEGQIWGEGPFDVADETGTTQMVIRKIRDGFAGTVSVDLANAEVEVRFYDTNDNPVDPPDDFDDLIDALESGELKELLYVTNWRLGGATLVQDPAFHSANITVVDDPQTLTAAVTGDADLPIADLEADWDGPAALQRLQDAELLNQGCFWRDPDAEADSTTQADYKLPFADIFDGQLRAVPAGIFAVAGVLQGGMGGVDIPEDDAEAVRGRVSGYYERMRGKFNDDTIVPPWEDNEDDDAEESTVAALTAAAGIAPETTTWAEQVAAAAPMEPDPAVFTNPHLSGPTKVRVTDSGRVYGHLACWNTNHVGFPGQQVRPPRTRTDYAHFRRNRTRCSDGSVVWTGTIVMGTGHADMYVSSSAAMNHYDHTGHAVADVVCGEDTHGIWISGALKPGVSALQVLTLDRYSLSGDWRNEELVGACVVNVPGFPVSDAEASMSLAACGARMETPRPRARTLGGHTVAMVASGVVAPATARRRGVSLDQVVRRTITEVGKLVEAKLSGLDERVATTAIRATKEEREMAAHARAINAEAVEEARAAIEEDD